MFRLMDKWMKTLFLVGIGEVLVISLVSLERCFCFDSQVVNLEDGWMDGWMDGFLLKQRFFTGRGIS
ncbi:hypothetical protein BJX76DRAFT_323938 [Aspergillus varians]